jgi:hypothetical protein
LASATAASLAGLRAIRACNQGQIRLLPRRMCWIRAVAPPTSTLRSISSPAWAITPSLFLPAVEWFFGVSLENAL